MKTALLGLFLLALPPARDAFELRDGDRVAFIGNTFVERDLKHNALETLLTTRYRDRTVAFRNLGWSGDTVWGHARSGFGRPEDGFTHLTKHVADLKPHAIFLAYGMNESFEGEKGLPKFLEGLGRLLDMLEASRARIVMLSPVRHEDLGRPLPDPAAHNRDLRLYIDAMAKVAAKRGHAFVDLFELMGTAPKDAPFTENGIHLTAAGYQRAAEAVEKALGLPARAWRIELDPLGQAKSEGVRVEELKASTTSMRFTALDGSLPAGEERVLKITSLNGGLYTLKIDGQAIVSGTESQWAGGLSIHKGPAHEQAATLRETIGAKNFQYFNRWRPQNETYIFGFRKKEQGHLAPEFPKFDPIVAEKDAAIAKLRVPVVHTFVLEREK
ncbi:MAG TPA: SGNH/GDSL hydrolase family protein [Planctomycetota bacterium]|nr:SGNH/GDSL hydrolase family protein [Planctomycetota bacterium]